jgi:hypothetical protein
MAVGRQTIRQVSGCTGVSAGRGGGTSAQRYLPWWDRKVALPSVVRMVHVSQSLGSPLLFLVRWGVKKKAGGSAAPVSDYAAGRFSAEIAPMVRLQEHVALCLHQHKSVRGTGRLSGREVRRTGGDGYGRSAQAKLNRRAAVAAEVDAKVHAVVVWFGYDARRNCPGAYLKGVCRG